MNWTDEDISSEVERCIADVSEVFLVESKLNATRGGYQLIVKCESESGIKLDQLAIINRKLQNTFSLPKLDMDQVSVEVSSPGATYPVKDPRHFMRYRGFTMTIEHHSDSAPQPLEGEVVSVADAAGKEV